MTYDHHERPYQSRDTKQTISPKVTPDSTPCFTTCLTFLTWYMHFNKKSRGYIETTNLIDMSEIQSRVGLLFTTCIVY
jgi:hypothetical protein